MTERLKSGSFLNQHCSSGSLLGHCCLQLFSRYIRVCMKPGYHLLFRDAIVSVHRSFFKRGYLYASLFWLNGTKRNKARRVEMAARLSCSADSRPLLSFNASDAERERDLKSGWHCATLTYRETGFTQVLLHKYTRICTETFSEALSCTLLNPGLHRSWQLLNLANSLGLWEHLTLMCSGADYCCVPLTQRFQRDAVSGNWIGHWMSVLISLISDIWLYLQW